MIKYLPKIKNIFITILFFFLLVLPILSHPQKTIAQTPTPSAQEWVNDDEVTFIGKVAERSGEFLDWTLVNYYWSSVSSGSDNPLASFWATIRNIVYAFFTLFVLISAFVIIVTRGRNITIMRFIPRFIMILLLVTFSFALIQFIYQITDAIQGFFLKSSSPGCIVICQKDLLFVGFGYKDFQGYRLFGPGFDESVFVSLLLVKLTALTYYVMVGILLLRKIILWFFIIISPIFPLLLLYSPIRNTAKIWVGEFFRWLLYAPIFAIFLSGLVHLWSSSTSSVSGIPLKFDFNGAIEYQTAISILLGGPGQVVGLNNSVNNKDTFALYVVALLMLWVVIILPFLLLQIFLDFLHDFSFGESALIKQLVAGGSSLVGRGTGGQPPPPTTQPEGVARPLPFTSAKIAIPQIQTNEVIINRQAASARGAQTSSDFLRLANLSIPTMRDIAKYETSLLSSDIGKHQDIARLHETLEGIANPKRVTVPTQRDRYNSLQERLKQEAQRGDPLATSILSAANAVTKTGLKPSIETAKLNRVFQGINNINNVSSLQEREKLSSIKSALTQAQQKGDPLANSILFAMQKGESGIDESLKQKLLEAKEKGSTLAVSFLEAAGAVPKTGLKPSIETAKLNRVFQGINNINNVSSLQEREKLSSIKNALTEAQKSGDPLANSILSAMQKGEAGVDDNIKQQILEAKEKGNALAASILEGSETADLKGEANFPVANRVQAVSIDDYESVKKIWQENYQKLEPPKAIDGRQRDRKEWILNDMDKISDTINLLVSADTQNVTKGMEAVGAILPFLLIGGFAQTEVIAYLKAKLEAAKTVIKEISTNEEEGTTMLDASKKKEEKPKEMKVQEVLPEPEEILDRDKNNSDKI